MNLVTLRTLVQHYEHIHIVIGIIGNTLFVVGSVLFYKDFEQYYTFAVSLFVVGSAFMLIGAVGNGLRRLWQHREEVSSLHARTGESEAS
jgi:fucose permease